MIDYSVGDVVVCVLGPDDSYPDSPIPDLPLNSLWTVASIEPDPEPCASGCELLVTLCEVDHSSGWTYCSCTFRKAYTPDAKESEHESARLRWKKLQRQGAPVRGAG